MVKINLDRPYDLSVEYIGGPRDGVVEHTIDYPSPESMLARCVLIPTRQPGYVHRYVRHRDRASGDMRYRYVGIARIRRKRSKT